MATEYEVLSYPPPPDDSDLIPMCPVLLDNRAEIEQEAISQSFRSPPLSKANFDAMHDSEGRIVCDHAFRRAVFRGGIEEEIRQEAWRVLFGYFPSNTTAKEREALRTQKECRYAALKRRWRNVLLAKYPDFDLSRPDNYLFDTGPAYKCAPSANVCQAATSCCHSVASMEAEIYANRVPCHIESVKEALQYISKDVPRTDRHYHLFKEDNNPNLLVLRDALVTFTLLQPEVGYVQGMNDIFARFFIVFQSESTAFWCFVYYMTTVQRGFLAEGMLERIKSLRMLLQCLDPDLTSYLYVCEVSELIFCHKWLLLSFQREFEIDDGIRLLEILSSHHLELDSFQGQRARAQCSKNDSTLDLMSCEFGFDLFFAVAIFTLYRDKIFLCTDGSQVHQFISRLSGQLQMDQVLMQAERLFYRYCKKSVLDSFVLLASLIKSEWFMWIDFIVCDIGANFHHCLLSQGGTTHCADGEAAYCSNRGARWPKCGTCPGASPGPYESSIHNILNGFSFRHFSF
uniref:Rab-GAP TBC domain-containing protein n=1 Tax=Plectus sambesii TaxID=2011161 RepID=A0A914WAI5_9BILA